MTLILGMSKSEGVYLSVDFRVTDARTGRVIDDQSVKFLTMHYPPVESGVRALFAYTGCARLPDGTETAVWLRETLRGESEVPDASMEFLVGRLSRDYGVLRQPLIVNVLAVHGEQRFFGGLSNLRRAGDTISISDTFDYSMNEVSHAFVFSNGSGAQTKTATAEMERLRKQVNVTPRMVENHMNLLATANRRIAASCRVVSPWCHVSFLAADNSKFSSRSRVYNKRGDPAIDMAPPVVLYGVDLSPVLDHLSKTIQARRAGDQQPPPLDQSTFDRMTRRRR